MMNDKLVALQLDGVTIAQLSEDDADQIRLGANRRQPMFLDNAGGEGGEYMLATVKRPEPRSKAAE